MSDFTNGYPHIESQEDYETYQKRVAEFMRQNELNNLTRVNNDSEPFFSGQACECCLRDLGGNRIAASGYSRTGVIYEFDICTDCEYYAEYGQLDDMTMLDYDLS